MLFGAFFFGKKSNFVQRCSLLFVWNKNMKFILWMQHFMMYHLFSSLNYLLFHLKSKKKRKSSYTFMQKKNLYRNICEWHRYNFYLNCSNNLAEYQRIIVVWRQNAIHSFQLSNWFFRTLLLPTASYSEQIDRI